MRKVFVVALVLFALAFTFGFNAEQPQAAKSRCWYECDCNGTALYCCRSGAIVNCKVLVESPVECTQQAGC